MTVKELLLRVPEALKEGAEAPDAVVQFETEEPVHYVVEGGVVRAQGGLAPRADVTVRVKGEDLLRMIEGRLNPMTALMTGRLKVKGDVGLAQRLIRAIDRDKLLGKR
ncbi:MAG TPA: SCP2 sterol-binding domain-containing protein [Trueperaceae bacterium]